jgi:hypothetical protein
MKSLYLVAIIASLFATDALGLPPSTTILESGTQPFVNQGSLTIDVLQYIGCRFHLDRPVLVDTVGGGIGDAGKPDPTIFAAIAALPSPNGFPIGRPSDFQPVASTTFKTLYQSGGVVVDQLFPLNALLQPGDYALIFGSGRFGTAEFPALPGAAIARGYTQTSQASFFIGRFPTLTTSRWDTDPALHNFRFVIMGTVIPEPTTATLIATFASIASLRRRRHI